MLVIVEDGNLHPLAAFALDVETLWRLDVLEVDTAERRLERDDDLDELFRVALVDLDIETIDACELLEQYGLAFHHGLAGERANCAQAKHRGAVGDDSDQVPAGGEVARLARVAHDLVASGGNAR